MQTLRNLLSYKLQLNAPQADSWERLGSTRLCLTVGDEVYGYLQVEDNGWYVLVMHHRQDVLDDDGEVVRRDWVYWFNLFVSDDDTPDVDMAFVSDLVLDHVAAAPWLMQSLGLTFNQQRAAVDERITRLQAAASLATLLPGEQECLEQLANLDLDGYYAGLEALMD